MHPALSIIVFSTASGAGYGLLALLGVLNAAGALPRGPLFGGVAIAFALALVSAGLLSSMLHLGRPERAWRAVSQWRSSWLSREGVLALLTYPPAGLFWLGWMVWEPGGVTAVFGLISAVLAVATVYCTAMIYGSLKPVQQWHAGDVVAGYLALALMTGALWLDLLVRLAEGPGAVVTTLAVATPLIAWAVKERYWRFIRSSAAASTPESATGLGRIGRVTLFEAPHTEANYLMKEMGFRVARKHAERLRVIARVAGFALPSVLALIAALLDGWPAALLALVAALSATLGTLVERWLFFAEAKHTVTLYYGARAA